MVPCYTECLIKVSGLPHVITWQNPEIRPSSEAGRRCHLSTQRVRLLFNGKVTVAKQQCREIPCTAHLEML